MVKVAKEVKRAERDVFKVSQSAFKDFYKSEILFCPWAWKEKYINGVRLDDEMSDAVRDGVVFETKCIGAGVGGKTLTMDRKSPTKGVMLEFLKGKAEELEALSIKVTGKEKNADLEAIIKLLPGDVQLGERYQAEIDIDENVALFESLKKLYNCEQLHSQLYMETEDRKGTADWHVNMDWNGKRPVALIDLKYACTKYEKEFYNGWSQPAETAFNRIRRINGRPYQDTGFMSGFLDAGTLTDRIAYMESLTRYETGCIQAVWYCDLYFKNYGVWPRWFFWIFGKSGWMRIKQVELGDLAAIEALENCIDIFRSDLAYYEKNGFDYNPTYAGCMGCDFAKTCEHFKKFPEVEKTYFSYA